MPKHKVLLTVTTYPLPSRSYDELVCTAGVLEDGSWIRIYPVPLSFLMGLKQSGKVESMKYTWIELELNKRVAYKKGIESLCNHWCILSNERGSGNTLLTLECSLPAITKSKMFLTLVPEQLFYIHISAAIRLPPIEGSGQYIDLLTHEWLTNN